MILNLIENAEISDKADEMSISTFASLASCITAPYPVYHKKFVAEVG